MSEVRYGRRSAMSRTSSVPDGDMDDDSECSGRGNGKRKTRNLSEKKRRDQFNLLINELCAMVAQGNRKMDKTTVLKATIAFLRRQKEITAQSQANQIKEHWKPPFLSNNEFTQMMLEALDGFLLVFTQAGNILYISESVTSLLGHLPGDLLNTSVYDYFPREEQLEIYRMLTSHQVATAQGEIPDYEQDANQLSFTCHFQRGSPDPNAQLVYDAVKFIGNFRCWSSDIISNYLHSSNEEDSSILKENICFCATVRLNAPQMTREMTSVGDETKMEFTARHSLEWKFLFLDHRGPQIIGYLPFEVLGTSGYDYYHPDDMDRVVKGHEQLMQTGKGKSCYYRFLTKGMQWIWLQTRSYITYHQWNSKPEFIVCTNKVVSFREVRAELQQELGVKTENSLESNATVNLSNSLPSQSPATPLISPHSTPSKPGQNVSQSPGSPTESETERPHSILEDSQLLSNSLMKEVGQSAVGQSVLLAQQQPLQVISQPVPGAPGSIPLGATMLPTSILGPQVQQVPMSYLSTASEAESSIPSTAPTTGTTALTSMPANISQSPVYLTPAQKQLQEQLRDKHLQLQNSIMQQQKELQLISEQLMLTQQVFFTPNHQAMPATTAASVAAGPAAAFPLGGIPVTQTPIGLAPITQLPAGCMPTSAAPIPVPVPVPDQSQLLHFPLFTTHQMLYPQQVLPQMPPTTTPDTH